MDAATLYIVLTLPNGEQKASTVGERTWAASRKHIAFLKELKRLDPDARSCAIGACSRGHHLNCKSASRGTVGDVIVIGPHRVEAARRCRGSLTCATASS
jgi:hypothetical protein